MRYTVQESSCLPAPAWLDTDAAGTAVAQAKQELLLPERRRKEGRMDMSKLRRCPSFEMFARTGRILAFIRCFLLDPTAAPA